MQQLRHFCFTINNYTSTDIEQVKNLPYKYLIFGYEVGENNTPHLQGYCSLKSLSRFTTLKKLLPRAHFEKAMGNWESNFRYCSKDGKFEEFGERPRPGARTDLDHCRDLALHEGMRAVTAECTMQQIRVAEKFLEYNEPARDWAPEVIWLWGESGAGKSRLARELTTDPYTKNVGTKWWNGYDRHEHVIIDDFRDSWWDLTYLLGLLDRYEFRVETKGGMRQFLAKKIVLTSVTPPLECYKYAKNEPIKQLLRRITSVTEVGGNTTPLPGPQI